MSPFGVALFLPRRKNLLMKRWSCGQRAPAGCPPAVHTARRARAGPQGLVHKSTAWPPALAPLAGPMSPFAAPTSSRREAGRGSGIEPPPPRMIRRRLVGRAPELLRLDPVHALRTVFPSSTGAAAACRRVVTGSDSDLATPEHRYITTLRMQATDDRRLRPLIAAVLVPDTEHPKSGPLPERREVLDEVAAHVQFAQPLESGQRPQLRNAVPANAQDAQVR